MGKGERNDASEQADDTYPAQLMDDVEWREEIEEGVKRLFGTINGEMVHAIEVPADRIEERTRQLLELECPSLSQCVGWQHAGEGMARLVWLHSPGDSDVKTLHMLLSAQQSERWERGRVYFTTQFHVEMARKIMWMRECAEGMMVLFKANLPHGCLCGSNCYIDQAGHLIMADYAVGDPLQLVPDAEHFFLTPRVKEGSPPTMEDDIFSFAVLLLVVFCGRKETMELLCDEGASTSGGVRKWPSKMEVFLEELPIVLSNLIRMCLGIPPEEHGDEEHPDEKYRDEDGRWRWEVVIQQLNKAFLEFAIPDEGGRALWKAAFEVTDQNSRVRDVVALGQFIVKFKAALQKCCGYDPHAATSEASGYEMAQSFHLGMSLMQKFICMGGFVCILVFGRFLSWYGPLCLDGKVVLFEKLRKLASKSWFHGDVRAAEAQRLLQSRPKGTFLVRQSDVLGQFTVSVASETGVDHHRIEPKPHTSIDIINVIESSRNRLGLRLACPGSTFRDLG